jgi:hypothetical protein
MFTIVLVVGLLTGMYCLALGASCLVAALRENDLPDIEDIQVQETAISEARTG